ncbi:peptide chain release factor 1 [Peptoniphilus koenoeneniae]|uniref:Peptide chain release factor 1 n=1 Tax=Peptoniphilus koenoeneniae TaxID=507751 RepID=A0ABU0ASJ8_9FIRM|nr:MULTISPECIES: peptide chain release factor 1 [Peptoniphilus]ERT56876.1 peptide chain release factor 1 [Peptoniphilus sp. BV3C26]MDQ0274231.1 peptide chain release factor 1 [Peptoniphilus koenoeneniae]
MFENLEVFQEKYKELEKQLIDVNVINNSELFQKVSIEYANLGPIVEKYKEYKSTKENIEDLKKMLQEKLDDEMKELVKEELKEDEDKVSEIEEELKILLVPKDPNDNRNVIVEIRAGVGGDEAALFAGVLFRQYTRYAERNGWKVDVMSTNEIGIGGYKEVVFMIEGKGAYSKLKFESGVHRVQRVPETESGGRIHTSTATVAVLPEAEDVEVEINPQDIQIDVFRASGNGGQCVNTTDSAVRLTHIPTGIVISMQDEKSQLRNKEKAMKILKTKLYDMKIQEQNKELSAEKKNQIGTGDRSERIRTYNYPQGRVTDHRIGLTSHKIDAINDGELDELIDALTQYSQAKKIENMDKELN